ncbi:MAG: bifunctional helix-turn-helix transcriptional regulator/GNAT family N-acetyltransferase, partial [Kangiellaceae bacterium]|nr:bifunctional helix-turn-helix transcriptional regulator/GNAT family N-acetyltransferase [Kangiellaceae bacterium]
MTETAQLDLDVLTEKFRHFNRFYTEKIGVLNNRLVDSEFSLTEARVLYEIANEEKNREGPSAQDLQQLLHIDRGQLSRILKDFESKGLIRRSADKLDARKKNLQLTRKGKNAFSKLNQLSQNTMRQLLSNLNESQQTKLVAAINDVEACLNPTPRKFDYQLRRIQPGDIGYIAHRQMLLYQQAYGWGINYEIIAAEILCDFVKNFDPLKEQSWIAEANGKIIGSVFLAKESDEVSKLRLLYVEAEARGLGLGTRLVEECINFAKQ